MVWVLDGYTTSSRYPYSENADNSQLAPDSGLRHTFNYVRNSVKATVDAYDGTVTFYVVDPSDPIVIAWQKAFPSLFTPREQIPIELAAHFRYPEDLFRVQTNMYARYHVDDPQQFFQRDQFWSVAQEPPQTVDPAAAQVTTSSTNNGITTTTTRAARFSPYYTLLNIPGQAQPEFSLVRPFVPFSETDERKNLIALMTVSSDPADYGKLRVLNIKSPDQIDGPALVDSNIKRKYAADFTLQSQTGSKVRLGDLQAIPIGQSILWVRPWYVQAEQTPTPQLTYVVVAYGDNIFRARTLEGALKLAFPDANITFSTTVGPITSIGPTTEAPNGDGGTSTGGGTTTTTPTTGAPADVTQLLNQANQLYQEARDALSAGDLGAYQSKIEAAFKLVQQAEQQAGGAVSGAPPATDTSGPPTSDST